MTPVTAKPATPFESSDGKRTAVLLEGMSEVVGQGQIYMRTDS